MRQRNLEAMMNDLATCKALNYDARCEFGIAPNEIKFPDNHCAVLVCRQSNDGNDFCVSQGGLLWCLDQERLHPGIQTYVLLVDRAGNFVNQATIGILARLLNGTPPQPPTDTRYGPYWWISAEFQPAAQSKSKAQKVANAPWAMS